jgi:hypothetical protein
VFSRATIKVFLAFYITSSAKLDGGPFNDLKLHFTTWQYTDGQHHSCYRVSHPKGSSRQASAKFLVCPLAVDTGQRVQTLMGKVDV